MSDLEPRAVSTPSVLSTRAQAGRVLLASVIITAALYIVPVGDVLDRPLLLLSTLVHELGHGITALLVGGDFLRLEMSWDGAGVAFSGTSSDLQRALVAAGGLVGPAFAAMVGFVAGRTPVPARLVLLLAGVLGLVTTVLWARGTVALLVTIVLTALALAVALGVRAGWAPQLFLVFFSVQLGLSVFSRGEYLFTTLSDSTGGHVLSDSERIGAELFGPFWLWGALCGLVSVSALLIGLRLYTVGLWRRRPEPVVDASGEP